MSTYVLELSYILHRPILRALVKYYDASDAKRVIVTNNDNLRITTVVLFELYVLNKAHP